MANTRFAEQGRSLGPSGAEETLLLSPKANVFWAKCDFIASQHKVQGVEPFMELVKAFIEEPIQRHSDSSGSVGVLDSSGATEPLFH